MADARDAGSTRAGYVRTHARRFVRELEELVAFPSVSAAPTPALAACARWLVDHLRGLGSRDARLVSTPGAPVVVGSIAGDPRGPTVLVYSHYDVQPASPAWRPFEPRVVGGYLIGRGASDAKGQLFAHLKAIELWRGRLPCRVVFVIEGEEEIGSPHVAPVIDQIDADVAVVSDTAVLAIDRPSITYSLRGDVYLDVEVRGADVDRHSGTYGGAAPNALRELVHALAGLHDRDGLVRVRGVASSPALAPVDRASIEIAGLTGGYTGTGVHGVIPAAACAKLDVRLVPHQDPDRVHRAIFAELARSVPLGLELVTRERARATPVVLDRGHPTTRAAARAYRRGFGVDPTFVRSGGSIPIVARLARIPTVLMGFALPDDGAHGPNERYSLAMLGKAIATAAAFLDEVTR